MKIAENRNNTAKIPKLFAGSYSPPPSPCSTAEGEGGRLNEEFFAVLQR
jgi:hypothetical protein